MSRTVIQVENLSKRYRIGLKEKQAKTLAGQFGNLIKSPWQNLKRLRELSRFGLDDESVFWALKDINFEVKEGEVLGIIGKNGAGKSTLLKILSQITEPTTGQIKINGRVASLLEVGTGFHPELSGRENIYMNGTILGMTRKEIDLKLDEIIDFSGVEKFIDTPVKFYSSGMKVRLGFSVAAHLEPEILIIDEVLAVGDYEFQKKCLGKMEDVSKNQGRTVLFVSHNMTAVHDLCSKIIVMKNGINSKILNVNEGIDDYINHAKISNYLVRSKFIQEVKILNHSNNNSDIFKNTGNLNFEFYFKKPFPLHLYDIGFFIKDHHGIKITAVSTSFKKRNLFQMSDEFISKIHFEIEDLFLVDGEYSIDISITLKLGGRVEYIQEAKFFQISHSDFYSNGFRLNNRFGAVAVKFNFHGS